MVSIKVRVIFSSLPSTTHPMTLKNLQNIDYFLISSIYRKIISGHKEQLIEQSFTTFIHLFET